MCVCLVVHLEFGYFLLKYLFFVYMGLCECILCVGTKGGKKGAFNPLQLELTDSCKPPHVGAGN